MRSLRRSIANCGPRASNSWAGLGSFSTQTKLCTGGRLTAAWRPWTLTRKQFQTLPLVRPRVPQLPRPARCVENCPPRTVRYLEEVHLTDFSLSTSMWPRLRPTMFGAVPCSNVCLLAGPREVTVEVAKDLVKARACAGCFLCPPPFGQYCWLDGLLRLGALDPRAPSRDDWPCARVFLARATFLSLRGLGVHHTSVAAT